MASEGVAANTTMDAVTKKWAQVVARARADESFKKRLTAEPGDVLQEYGIRVQPGVEVRIVENTDRVTYITIPAIPVTPGEMSAAQIEGVVGGTTLYSACCKGTHIPEGTIEV